MMQTCKHIVKALDHEGYLVSLLYPQQYLPQIWALRAINAQCAVDEKRIPFYKLDIQKKQTPMTQLLPPLNDYWLNRMMTSKLIHNHRTLEELEEYSEASVGSLLYLSLEIMGIKDIKMDHTVSHIGKCIGLINTIRGIGYFAKKRKCYIPNELLGKYNITEEDVFNNKLDHMEDIVHSIASRAFQHKETALDHMKSVSPILYKRAFPVLLHIVPCFHHLAVLDRLQFDITNKELYKKNHLLLFQILRRRATRRI